MRIKFLIICALAGCSVQMSPWSLDTIAAGDAAFNASRLRFISTEDSPLCFEMVKMGETIESQISLTRFRIKKKTDVPILFRSEQISFEERVAVHEGGMRVRLSDETTQKIIQILQKGQKVAIILDDFEEVLDSSQFSSSFDRFVGEVGFFQNIFKGPVQ